MIFPEIKVIPEGELSPLTSCGLYKDFVSIQDNCLY